MKITGLKKFGEKTKKEKGKLNELLIKSNIALNITSRELVRASAIIYNVGMIASYMGSVIALITNNKDALNNSNLSPSILEDLKSSWSIISEKAEDQKDENDKNQESLGGLSK